MALTVLGSSFSCTASRHKQEPPGDPDTVLGYWQGSEDDDIVMVFDSQRRSELRGGRVYRTGRILENAGERMWLCVYEQDVSSEVRVERDPPPGVGASDVLRLDLNGPSAPVAVMPTPAPDAAGEPPPVFELPPAEQLANGGYRKTLERFEKAFLASALAKTGGRYRSAARLLGMERNTLRQKARRYGIG